MKGMEAETISHRFIHQTFSLIFKALTDLSSNEDAASNMSTKYQINHHNCAYISFVVVMVTRYPQPLILQLLLWDAVFIYDVRNFSPIGHM